VPALQLEKVDIFSAFKVKKHLQHNTHCHPSGKQDQKSLKCTSESSQMDVLCLIGDKWQSITINVRT